MKLKPFIAIILITFLNLTIAKQKDSQADNSIPYPGHPGPVEVVDSPPENRPAESTTNGMKIDEEVDESATKKELKKKRKEKRKAKKALKKKKKPISEDGDKGTGGGDNGDKPTGGGDKPMAHGENVTEAMTVDSSLSKGQMYFGHCENMSDFISHPLSLYGSDLFGSDFTMDCLDPNKSLFEGEPKATIEYFQEENPVPSNSSEK